MTESADVVESEKTDNENGNVIDIGKQDISKVLEKKKQVIKKTVAKDANKQEFEMFMHLAKTYQLDPFQKEIFFWKIKGQSTIMTSRDGYLKIANRHPKFDGLVSDVVHENDDFNKTQKGVNHSYSKDRGEIIGAYALVYRKDRSFPIYVFAPYNEYKADKKVWKQYPSAMILKCAESMALKRAFSVSGLVSKEEMEVQENPVNDYGPTSSRRSKSKEPEDVTDEGYDNNSNQNTAQNEQKQGKMTFKKAQSVIIPGGEKYEDKPASEVEDWRLEWVAENWNEEKVRKAAQIVLENRDTDDSKKNDRKLTEREKEMKEIIDSNKELRKEMINYMSEYDTKKLDDLSEEQFEDLVTFIKTIKNPDEPEIVDEELADEVAAELEDADMDDFDMPEEFEME